MSMPQCDPLGRRLFTLAAVLGIGVAACSSEPKTDAQRLARGREIIERMSTTLGAAQAFSVTTTETRTEVKRDGQTRQVTLHRDTTMRRPNRLYSSVSGDRRNEVWYDGIGVSVAYHDERIFGQIRAPETLDKTLDAMHERYGVSTPLADYVYSSPAKALLSDTTTGGWVKRETIDGRETDHLAFRDKGVNWEIWIPVSGDPLPVKASADFTENPRFRKMFLTFSDWNLSPQIPGNRFEPAVPADYEGVAIIQRARVLRNLPEDTENGSVASTTGEKK